MLKQVAILIIAMFFLSSCTEKKEELPQKPNILFIMSDDHAYQAISAYTDHLITTPNIDRIANE